MLNLLLFVSTYFSSFIIALVHNHAFAFVIYQLVYFYNPLERWWGGSLPRLSYSLFTVMLMFAVLVLGYKTYKKNRLLSPPQFKWFYIIVALYGSANFYAVLPDLHYDAFINFLKLAIIISIAYKLCDSDSKLNLYLFGYIFGSWYISFLAYQVGRNSSARVEGIGTVDAPESNGIAAAIAPSLVLCLYFFWVTKRKALKIPFVIAGVFIANALVLINSRGAFLAASISISYFMFFMYFSSSQRRYQKTVAIFITMAGLAGFVYIADDTFFDRMSTMKTEDDPEIRTEVETGSTRIEFWKAAIEMSKDHPLGAGNRGFDAYAPYYIPQDVKTGTSRNRSVHSTWFEALTEIGYLGFFAFILMILSTFKATKHCKRYLLGIKDIDKYFKIIAIEASLVSFMVSMTFTNRMRAEILYWIILFSAIAYNIYVVNADKSLHKAND